MLDDLKYIHERDAQDALGVAQKQATQYLHNYNFSWQPPRAVTSIVVAGMGGSGLAAKAYKAIVDPPVPFEVIQGYELPAYVNQESLLICSSYSGNTEETLSVAQQALSLAEPPMIAVITSGGSLGKLAQDKHLPCIILPAGYQPRHTFGYQYRALLELLATTGLTDDQLTPLTTATQGLETSLTAWLPTVASKHNLAKQIALDVIGKSVVIYAGPKFFPVAYKWKISFNENAKQIAWTNQFPEFNHNEFMGWTEQPIDKPYTVIDLRSSFEHPQIQKRFAITARMLSGRRPEPVVVTAIGETLMEQLLWTIVLGDFVTLYTALANGLNPTPVDLIENFKHALTA